MAGNAGKGRVKGSKNKSTAAVKELLLAVNDKIGGEATMIEWAKGNLTEFYKLLGRLIPQEVSGPNGGPIPIEQIRREIVDPQH